MLVSTLPDIADTGQYSVGEAARLLGVHRNTLNRYVKERLLRCHYHRSGRKFFYGRDLVRCWRAVR